MGAAAFSVKPILAACAQDSAGTGGASGNTGSPCSSIGGNCVGGGTNWSYPAPTVCKIIYPSGKKSCSFAKTTVTVTITPFSCAGASCTSVNGTAYTASLNVNHQVASGNSCPEPTPPAE